MHCKKCGKEIEEGKEYCDNCSKETEKIVVTYEDKQVVVDAPVIIESHTFIDENGKLKEQIDEHIKPKKNKVPQKQKENIKQESAPIPNEIRKTLFFLIILLIVAIFAAVFVVKNMYEPKMNDATGDVKSIWNNETIKIDGIEYKLNDSYSKFQKNGWTIDEDTVRIDYVIVGSQKKTQDNIEILNEKLHKKSITIGLENTSEYAKELTECTIYSIEINNYQKENKISFILPGGLSEGTTEDIIFKKYGNITNKNDIKEDIKGYTVYKYREKNNSTIELYVYKDKGLQGFKYKK